LLISTFSTGKSFVITTAAEAFNGKPPCCAMLPAELPSALYKAFKGVQPIEFKLLGTVKKIHKKKTKDLKMSVSVLALIEKTYVRDVSAKNIVIEVSIPENTFSSKYSFMYPSISEKDYVLLLPTKIYNEALQENMYDFVKIPKEMIK
jgi:hypothetical protein